ncbi:hypothetical protein BGZ93_008280 [Podila epicladia]|nr:hypothetical protein BGZ93_008280 [Podila epicladia]
MSKHDKKKKPIKAKKLDKKPKDRPVNILDNQSKNVLTMPNLQQVLEKKTSFPLGYDDFEAFLRTQRAAEYLNFWADVTAHEQLCRTFDVSERRQMRELQLEERAITRDKRRVALLQHAEAHHSSYQTDHRQELNNSNLYLTSRSSLQLPLTDHLSFPAENRRFGLQDSTSAYAPPARRQTFDHDSSGAYNKLLQGVESSIHGRRSSMDRTRTSIDRYGSTTPFSSQHHFGPPSSSTPTSYNQMMRKRGSTDILAGTKASTGDNQAGDLQQSTSEQQLSSESHPNILHEIEKLTQAVEESIQLSLANSDPGAPPHSVLEPSLFRKPSTTFDRDLGPLQAPLAIRRSVDGSKPVSIPQEPKTLLVQSYRTISLEDVQESALRIYRKFLIQLRTASMAAEEAVSSSKRATSAPGLPRGSVDGVAQRWDGYAEQVIAEWNEKWRDCGPEARRLRRLSGRTGVSERGDGSHREDFKNENHQGPGSNEPGSEQGLSEEQMAREEAMAKRRSGTGFTAFLNRLLRTETTILELPTLTINTTTVEEEAAASDESDDSGDEEEDYDSDIDDDDDDEEDDEVDGNTARKDIGVPPGKDSEIELQAVVTTETPIPLKKAETIGGSTAADSRRSSTSASRSSCSQTSEQELEHEDMPLPRPVTAGPIRKSTLNTWDQTRDIRSNAGKVMPDASKVAKSGPLVTMLRQERHASVSSMETLNPFGSPKVDQPSFLASLKAAGGSIVPTKHDKEESGQGPDLEKGIGDDSRPLQRLSSASLPSPLHPTYPNSLTSSSPAPLRSAPLPHPSLSTPGDTGSTVDTSFYLPLECRQRIHAQVLEEGRTEAPHLFGPAKGFVVEIVLRDYYYPLFLEHVQQQNLGLSSHRVSIIRKRGMLGIGIVLWVLVVTAQVIFVLVGLGGWASPLVWAVGLLGGWAGSVCLTTGILGFSPVLGLGGQIAEDRHVWRFRKIVDPSIRILHFRRSVWMMTYCAFWSSVVMVIFAALPARE